MEWRLHNHPHQPFGDNAPNDYANGIRTYFFREIESISRKINANFIDYKNREIVESETRDLRNILYAKAFANSDDFVEFEFDE